MCIIITDRKQSRHHYVLIPVLVPFLILVLGVVVMMKKRLQVSDTGEQGGQVCREAISESD